MLINSNTSMLRVFYAGSAQGHAMALNMLNMLNMLNNFPNQELTLSDREFSLKL